MKKKSLKKEMSKHIREEKMDIKKGHSPKKAMKHLLHEDVEMHKKMKKGRC